MALIRSLNTAVAGLKAQQFRIEVVGNNIANVDTTAFKGSRVDFSTLLSQTMSFGTAPQGFLGGIDPVQVGLGAQVASSTADFGQGPTEATGVSTDLAIQGEGFFILNDAAGGAVYTRDGSFTINPANLLHDPSTGFVVQGWMADENFQVTPGGPVQNVEIQVGVQTIARPTSIATFGGNLNSSGNVGTQGSLLISDRLYDDRFTNDDLISEQNPLGLERATSDTPLANLVRSLGDFVSYTATTAGTAATSALLFPGLATQASGVEISMTAQKGERELPGATFTVGDPPPTGGTTLGEFMSFIKRQLGVSDGLLDQSEQVENTLSYARMSPVTGEEVNGTLATGDTASLTGLTDLSADFRGVAAGDFIRFNSGAAAGQVAQITAVSASIPGGALDTLTLRSDGFNSLTVVPATGDTYVVHAPAGVSAADDVELLAVDSTSGTVSVSGNTTSGAVRTFTVTDTAITDYALQHNLMTGQRVEFLAGGVTVVGRILEVSGDNFMVATADALGLTPDAGTTFSIIKEASGSIELAGNLGSANHLSDLELVSNGARVSLFDNPPLVAAEGESLHINVTGYDSLGTARQVELTFVFEGSTANGPNIWRYIAESADDVDRDRVVGSGTVVFGSNGQFLTTGNPSETVSIDLDASPEAGGGVTTPFTFELDLSRLTQFATTLSEVTLRDQDGFAAGTLREFAVGEDGIVTGIFSNGLARTLGQIPIARFANPNGLDQEGENMFRISNNSGIAQLGPAGTFGRGLIQGGMLEESNVDLAEQFTDLIIGQRAFQANARTITVSDEMLQELVNLI
ncbi:MAG: flagellar hook-basal body complex protein [Planctomycetota bacterium]